MDTTLIMTIVACIVSITTLILVLLVYRKMKQDDASIQANLMKTEQNVLGLLQQVKVEIISGINTKHQDMVEVFTKTLNEVMQKITSMNSNTDEHLDTIKNDIIHVLNDPFDNLHHE